MAEASGELPPDPEGEMSVEAQLALALDRIREELERTREEDEKK